MDYEGICPICGGYLYGSSPYGTSYLMCDTCEYTKYVDTVLDIKPQETGKSNKKPFSGRPENKKGH